MSKSFSIITPCFNSEKFISLAIESVINTGYDLSKIEHIIVNDGSTDNTEKIVLEFAKKYRHIKYYKKENGHWGSVVNYVKQNKLVSNEFVVIQDSDDVFLKKCFSIVDKKINGFDLFFTSFYFWNGKKRKIPCWPYFFVFKRTIKNKLITPTTVPLTVFMKKELFYHSPTLIEGRPFQDWILYPSLVSKSKNMGFTSRHCAKYWNSRAGNTMSKITNEKSLQVMVENLQHLAQNDFSSLCFFYLMAFKPLTQYMKQKNIKIIAKSKPTFKWFPFYIRWAIFFWHKASFDKFFIVKSK